MADAQALPAGLRAHDFKAGLASRKRDFAECYRLPGQALTGGGDRRRSLGFPNREQ